jgi:hypothetical protein
MAGTQGLPFAMKKSTARSLANHSTAWIGHTELRAEGDNCAQRSSNNARLIGGLSVETTRLEAISSERPLLRKTRANASCSSRAHEPARRIAPVVTEPLRGTSLLLAVEQHLRILIVNIDLNHPLRVACERRLRVGLRRPIASSK